MRFVVTVAVILVSAVMALHTVLQNGSLMRYLDTHAHPRVPRICYYLGEGYLIFGDLQNSATYFWRAAEKYPKSDYADKSYFRYLQNLDDMNTPRLEMADLYQTYLDRFPEGEYKVIVQRRIENCRNAR